MDQWLQWAITTIVGLLGLLAGRAWERYDRKVKKDQNLVDKIHNVMPIDSVTLELLRNHDFGTWFERRLLNPLHELENLLNQPSCFFLNNKLEKKKIELRQTIHDFLILIAFKTFINDNMPDLQGLDNPDDAFVRVMQRQGLEQHLSEIEIDQLRETAWDKYRQTKDELNSKSSAICENYDALMKTAHRIL